MALSEQEIPLVLIAFLGSLGSAVILFYRSFLYPKQSTALIQKVYNGASLFSIFLSVTSALSHNKTLFLLNWILSGFLMLYFVISIFLPSNYRNSMLTWSDLFLVGLSFVFFLMRFYTSLLLTYDRSKKKQKPIGLRPIPKPADFYTLDYPNSIGNNSGVPTII